jgi:hypothetical protein
MTRDDVIRMVREIADKTTVDPVHGDPPLIVVSPDEMARFAALVAAAERKACVEACEGVEQITESQSWVVSNCVGAILERGKV